MVDILQRVAVRHASPQQVYDAIATLDGLSGWWTEKTAGDPDLGGILQLRFTNGGVDLRVIGLEPARSVQWEVVDGPSEWVGTSIRWDLQQDGDYTVVLFKHEGWREPVEFMHHCTTKWATFLLSLKALVETGEGAPNPRDVEISDWH